MKILLILIPLFLNTYTLFGQTLDSVATENSSFRSHVSEMRMKSSDSSQNSSFAFHYQPRKEKQIVIKDHLVFYTDYILLSPVETEITDLESRECMALLKRDNVTLTALWEKDFTLDEPANGLATSANSLPYYISFVRTVEKFSAFDNIVFTSGYESFQQLKPNGKIDDIVKKNYSHTWTKKAGVWKLTTNTHGSPTKSDLTISFPEAPVDHKNRIRLLKKN